MTRRAARFLTRLYPPHWRARYGEEFQTFLESRRVLFLEILNILGSALSERLAGFLTMILYACVVTFSAGGAIYLKGSGGPVVQVIESHPVLWLCWSIIETGSLAMIAAGVVTVAPVAIRILRTTSRYARFRLVNLVITGLFLIVGLTLAAAGKSWALSGTLIVLASCLLQAAHILNYVIAHTELSHSLGRRKLAVLAMAASLVATTIISAGLGLDEKDFDPGHPDLVGWSLALLLLGLIAIQGGIAARRRLVGRME